MTEPLRIAWLTTGRGEGSYGALECVLRAIETGLPVELAVVFVNREEGEAAPTDRLLELVRSHGIPLETLSSVRFRREVGGERSRAGAPLPAWRYAYDRAVAERLAKYDFRLGVLFGYMLIVTAELHERFLLINDHPALPEGPTGPYEQVILELIRRGERESGCMYHVVTGDVDRGPVIAYCRFPIRDEANESLWRAYNPSRGVEDPLWQDIRARGLRRERPFVVETLRAIAEGRLAVPPQQPLDLTAAVEAAIRAKSPG